MNRLAGCEVILVDTPGRSPRNAEHNTAWMKLLNEIRPDEVHLVIPAPMRLEARPRRAGGVRRGRRDESPASRSSTKCRPTPASPIRDRDEAQDALGDGRPGDPPRPAPCASPASGLAGQQRGHARAHPDLGMTNQLDSLRRFVGTRMPAHDFGGSERVLLVGSGKGGVGTSTIAALHRGDGGRRRARRPGRRCGREPRHAPDAVRGGAGLLAGGSEGWRSEARGPARTAGIMV